jgi:hypothetical protein
VQRQAGLLTFLSRFCKSGTRARPTARLVLQQHALALAIDVVEGAPELLDHRDAAA